MKLLAVYGTRPEYIKLKPILQKDNTIKCLYIKQHVDIIKFDHYDYSIDIEPSSQNRLNSIFQQIFLKAEPFVSQFDGIIVQGDTATVCAVSLVAFHLKKKIYYVEAGLRSYDLENPYPEEAYRQITSRISTVNFCPTQLSFNNLKKEKVMGTKHIVGNTVLDNIKNTQTSYTNNILITIHRTENLHIINEWFKQIDKLAKKYTELNFLLTVHPNPLIVKASVNLKFTKISDPLQHKDLIDYLSKCKLVITDSGGIQEEACFLNKKIIVCRKTTERPEGIHSGHIHLCKKPSSLNNIFKKIINNFEISSPCPYGDGTSSNQILQLL